MDNNKTLELEILIVVRQNKKVPVNRFHELFEEKWEWYRGKIDQLLIEGLFVPVQMANLPVYQLTGKGKAKITELLYQRERDISVRLSQVKPLGQRRFRAMKSIRTLLNSLVHFRLTSQKIREPEPQSPINPEVGDVYFLCQSEINAG